MGFFTVQLGTVYLMVIIIFINIVFIKDGYFVPFDISFNGIRCLTLEDENL